MLISIPDIGQATAFQANGKAKNVFKVVGRSATGDVYACSLHHSPQPKQ